MWKIHKKYINRLLFYPSSVPKLNEVSPCTPDGEVDGQNRRVRGPAPAAINNVINQNNRAKKIAKFRLTRIDKKDF